MTKLKDMKIARKLITGFLIMSIISTIIGAVGVAGLWQAASANQKTYTNDTEPLKDMFDIVSAVYQMRIELRNATLRCDDVAKVETAQTNYNTIVEAYKISAEKYKATIESAEMKALFVEAETLFTDSFNPVASKTFELARQGKQKEADAAGATSTDQITKMISNYNECLSDALADVGDSNKSNRNISIIVIIILCAVIVLGVAIAISLGRYLSNMISRPITKIVDAANEIALGNTDINIDVESDDETGMLAVAFNKMIIGINEQAHIADTISRADFSIEVEPRSINDKMGNALKRIADALNIDFIEIKDSAQLITVGSEQVSNGAQALSQGATEQASSIEEFSATLTQLSTQINENAEFATSGSKYMEKAVEVVAQCSEQMGNMLTSMENINKSSNEISKINKVIDDIAFQTNILALNAAVEAARAGTAGKGFAVVAAEVRNLASKSADAAKQTTALIDESIKMVASGAKIAEETAKSLTDVEEKTKYIGTSIDKLAQAANEQAIAIVQINQGIEQISSVIQTNSATAEESAAASEELSGQARSLNEMAGRMKLKPIKNQAKNIFAGNISLDDSFADTKNKDFAYDFGINKY